MIGSDKIRSIGWDRVRMTLCFAFALHGTLTAQDSARVSVLEHDIALAEVRLEATSFWKRVLPSIHLSASLGMKDALVYDPASSMLLPRDSYRLTFSFPLHELFRTDQHQEAAIRLRRLREEQELARKENAVEHQRKADRIAAVDRENTILAAELHLLREIVRYNELLFQQGKVSFDVLTRARLQVLQTERQILHLQFN
jgi:outer membrane protein TolC